VPGTEPSVERLPAAEARPTSAQPPAPEPRPVKFADAPEPEPAAAPAMTEVAEVVPSEAARPEVEARRTGKASDRKPVRRTVQVARRQEKTARPVQARAEDIAQQPEPEPEVQKTGLVMLRVNPWAEVFWSGRSMGITPMAAVELPAGKQVLTLRNQDLSLERKISVDVVPGSQVVVKADLLD
ncbi:MAG: hypothetical protein WBV82_31950, partial [Myxococcaceae bacterium]